MSEAAVRLAPAHEVVERALEQAAAAGVDEAVVVVSESSEAELRFANNTTTTNGLRRGRTVAVVAIRGGAAGVASRSGAGDTGELVAAALADTAEAPPAEDAFPLVEGPAADDFREGPVPTSLSVFGGILAELGDSFERARAGGRVLAGFAEHHSATAYVGTSTGLRLRHVQPTGKMELVARSADGSASAWAGAGSPTFADVDLGAMDARLTARLGWAGRRIDLPAGRYETLLPPDAVADFFVELTAAMSGRDAEDGSSVFSAPGGGTRVGETLSETPFRMWSDPAHPGVECTPFLVTSASASAVSVFDNGLPIGSTDWISEGKLRRLRYHRAGAARSGVEPALPCDNLALELPGAASTIDEMVSRTERGLLLTCLWYIRQVDPVTHLLTGLTRDGVYLIEGGEVVGAVNNFRFNESPVDLLARASEAGGAMRALSREWNEWENRTVMPALRIPDFNMSSVSPAT